MLDATQNELLLQNGICFEVAADKRREISNDHNPEVSCTISFIYCALDVLDGNNDPLSPGGGTSGPESGNENGSTNNNNGGKKKKKKGNQGDGRGTKKGKTNWT